MTNEIKVIRGIKIAPEDSKNLDPAKKGSVITIPAHEVNDVEGQELRWVYYLCPWCEHIQRIIIDTEYWRWYTCENCGGSGRACRA